MNEWDENDPRFEEYYACCVIIRKIIAFEPRDGFPLGEIEPCVRDPEHRWYEFCYHNMPQQYEPYPQ